MNIYEYVNKNKIYDEKSKIAFILNDNFINKIIFSDIKNFNYEKKYNNINKKKIKHIIYINEKNIN